MRIEPLDEGDHLLVTTFEPDGTAAATPLWFAGSAGRFVALVDAEDDLLRRIEERDRAEVAAGTEQGTVIPGAAVLAATVRALDDDAVASTERALRKKYRLRWHASQARDRAIRKARGGAIRADVAIEITLTEAI